MEKVNKKKQKLNLKQFCLRCIGLILICLAIIGATNQTFIGTFLTYSFSFLFGYYYFVILFLLLIFGFRLIFSLSSFPFKKHVSVWISLILIFVSVISLSSIPLYNTDVVNLSSFSRVYMEQMNAFSPKIFAPEHFSSLINLGGGYLGLFFMTLFGSIWGLIGDCFFFGVILLISLLLLLIKPIKKSIDKRKENQISNQYKSPYQNGNSDKFIKSRPTPVKKTVNPSLVAPLTSDFGRSNQGEFVASNKQNADNKQVNQQPTIIISHAPIYPSQPYYSNSSNADTSIDNSLLNQPFKKASVKTAEPDFNAKPVSSQPIDKNIEQNNRTTIDYAALYHEQLRKNNELSKRLSEQQAQLQTKNEQASFIESKNYSSRSFNNYDSHNTDYSSEQQKTPYFTTEPNIKKKIDTKSSDSYHKSNQPVELSDDEKEALLKRAQAFKANSLRTDNSTFDVAPDDMGFMNRNQTDSFTSSRANISSKAYHSNYNPLEAQAKNVRNLPQKDTGPKEFQVELPVETKEEQVSIEQNNEEMLEQKYFEIKRRKREAEEQKLKAEEDAKKAAVYKYVSKAPRVYDYPLPDDNLLEDKDDSEKLITNSQAAQEKAKIINNFFENFRIQAKAISYTIGASVTRFNIQTEPGVRSEKIASLANDLQIALNGDKSVRIETVVEGRSTSGIEIGNAAPMAVPFKEVFMEIEKNTKDNLLLPIGKDISGKIVTYPLNDMPHLLVAGTTGSGKSVLVHSMIMTLIMRNYPSQLKLMLIDPKQVEFAKYNLEPHLYCPVVSNPASAITALQKLCEEMDRRYSVLSKWHCVKISEYLEKRINREDQMEEMPNVVCVIDEFADLMQTGGDEVASCVQRLTQKARAAGIYLIIATQRPSKDVIPMTVKGNISCRIGLCCSTGVDSRVILDENGAETLLGKGDLLFKAPGKKSLIRAQSPFISNEDMERVLEYVHDKAGDPNYDPDFLDLEVKDEDPSVGKAQSFDDMYEEIKDYVMKTGIVSKSNIMRNFSISYSKSDQVIARLRSDGIVQSIQGGKNIVVQRRPMEE